MEKTGIYLRIDYLQDLNDQNGGCYDEYLDEYDFVVSAWDANDSMIDKELTYSYSELMVLGMTDICEGEMAYGGELNLEQLKEQLKNYGFNIKE